MERKRPRRTRERILETALALFNSRGEPGVTTSAIAEEMNISPGNLYYHFKSKEKIVEALFAAFRAEIEATLAAPTKRAPDAEDVWLFLHLVFEAIWRYRFIYRDVNDLIARHRLVQSQFRLILAHKQRTAAAILEGLRGAGSAKLRRAEIPVLAENMTLVASYWLSFEYAQRPRVELDAHALARGAAHVMALAAPYLAPRERALFDQLTQRYLT
jgi:AcrR family transcriptional regulator